MIEDIMKNPVLSEVVKLFTAQQAKGLDKYGALVDINVHGIVEWIEHAQQECIDNLVYLECLKQSLQKRF